jgi:hypothetical protein
MLLSTCQCLQGSRLEEHFVQREGKKCRRHTLDKIMVLNFKMIVSHRRLVLNMSVYCTFAIQVLDTQTLTSTTDM